MTLEQQPVSKEPPRHALREAYEREAGIIRMRISKEKDDRHLTKLHIETQQ